MKKMFFALLVVLPLTTLAQEEKGRYIEVTGSAEQEINPDIIILSIHLKEFEESKEKISLDQLDKELTGAFNISGIDKQNIEVADITANALSRKRRDREIFAEKTYEVRFSKASDVMTLLTNLKNVRLDALDIKRLDHTEMDKYRLDLKVAAIKAAAAKADALTSAVGAKRGKVLKIIEDKPNLFLELGDNNTNALSNTHYYSQPKAEGSGDLAFKKIKLRFEIQVTFEIE